MNLNRIFLAVLLLGNLNTFTKDMDILYYPLLAGIAGFCVQKQSQSEDNVATVVLPALGGLAVFFKAADTNNSYTIAATTVAFCAGIIYGYAK